jgi:hypothetical protein
MLFGLRTAGVVRAMSGVEAPRSRTVNHQLFEILAPFFGCMPDKFFQQDNNYSII